MSKIDKNKIRKRKELEFLPSAIEIIETPPSPVGRLVLWTIIIVVIIVLLWSFVGRVDEVVVAPAKVISVGSNKVVESEYQNKISKICVRDGQHVKEGDVLIEFDKQYNLSDLRRLQQTVSYYKIEICRLKSEIRDGQFKPSVEDYIELTTADIQSQEELYKQRVQNYKTKLKMAEANIISITSSIAVSKAKERQYQQILPKIKETEDSFKNLSQTGAVSKLELKERELSRIDAEHNLSVAQAEIAKGEADLNQAQQQVESVSSDYFSDIAKNMTQTMISLKGVESELNKAKLRCNADTLRAPVSGIVYDMKVTTTGEIVIPDAKILSIVPDNAVLEIEAKVSSRDIGLIGDEQKYGTGKTVDIKIDTYPFQKFGVLTGKVRLNSAESTEDDVKGDYYKVYINLNKSYFIINGRKNYVLPGMTAIAEIKVREKYIIEFFLDPFRKYQNEAFREK